MSPYSIERRHAVTWAAVLLISVGCSSGGSSGGGAAGAGATAGGAGSAGTGGTAAIGGSGGTSAGGESGSGGGEVGGTGGSTAGTGGGTAGTGGGGYACDSSNCAGCCDGDTCLTGTDSYACGAFGLACEVCPTDWLCKEGYCETPCGPDTCGGCCDGDVCVSGDQDNACGYGGYACDACGGNESCSFGSCVSNSCADTCNGCCSGDTCLGGDASTACGSLGNACIDCGTNRLCSNGDCAVDPISRWDVLVRKGTVNQYNASFEAWDSFGGLPDAMAEVTVGFSPDVESGSTSVYQDSLTPWWNEVVLSDVKADSIKDRMKLEVFDADVSFNDSMGSCTFYPTDEVFDGLAHEYDCARDTGAEKAGFKVDVIIRPH